MNDLLFQLVDLGLLRRDQLFELGDLSRVVALLVLAEAEEVGRVLRPPAMEVEPVLGDDRPAECQLAGRRPRQVRGDAGGQFPRVVFSVILPVNPQRVIALGKPGDTEDKPTRPGG